MIQGDIGFKVKDLHEKYGEIVRIAPDEVAFTSAAAVRGKFSLSQYWIIL
jgi:hypothetical protein